MCLQTSLLCFCRNSISCCVNVVIEMDFTLCGGFSPRKIPEQVVQTKDPTVMLTYVGPRWSQSKHFLFAGRLVISRSIFRWVSSCFRFALVAMAEKNTAGWYNWVEGLGGEFGQ